MVRVVVSTALFGFIQVSPQLPMFFFSSFFLPLSWYLHLRDLIVFYSRFMFSLMWFNFSFTHFLFILSVFGNVWICPFSRVSCFSSLCFSLRLLFFVFPVLFSFLFSRSFFQCFHLRCFAFRASFGNGCYNAFAWGKTLVMILGEMVMHLVTLH